MKKDLCKVKLNFFEISEIVGIFHDPKNTSESEEKVLLSQISRLLIIMFSRIQQIFSFVKLDKHCFKYPDPDKVIVLNIRILIKLLL